MRFSLAKLADFVAFFFDGSAVLCLDQTESTEWLFVMCICSSLPTPHAVRLPEAVPPGHLKVVGFG